MTQRCDACAKPVNERENYTLYHNPLRRSMALWA